MKIADTLRERIAADGSLTTLPSHAELVTTFGVSRGVVIRAVDVLADEGLVEAVRGARWRIVRNGRQSNLQPLASRIAAIITQDELKVGAPFPSATALCERFGVSRPTVRRALDKLEAQGLLSEGSQGKVRTVRALPGQEGETKL